jgi:hypothetical protein
MSTSPSDVAYEAYLARCSGPPGPRRRGHEDSSHVQLAIVQWLGRSGANVVRIHPQEICAGKTPIGVCVRIRSQAARTPIESSIQRMMDRGTRRPELMGVPIALALPDLPRLRQRVARIVTATPDLPITWLFVSRYGAVAVVPPPDDDRAVAGRPEGEGQSSTRSGLTA